VAFGIRNFSDMEKGLSEIMRSLCSGGHIVILEFSTPQNFLVRKLYSFYSNHILKPVGGLVSKDKKAYDYLPDSIVEFPEPEDFLEMMRRAGFTECYRRSQSFGIAQIYIGQKP
jgi:demethylmenaquinone methyltransferase/2-methoxy-6-polyprenyl-1,4-benzoquinol methylase